MKNILTIYVNKTLLGAAKFEWGVFCEIVGTAKFCLCQFILCSWAKTACEIHCCGFQSAPKFSKLLPTMIGVFLKQNFPCWIMGIQIRPLILQWQQCFCRLAAYHFLGNTMGFPFLGWILLQVRNINAIIDRIWV